MGKNKDKSNPTNYRAKCVANPEGTRTDYQLRQNQSDLVFNMKV